MGQERLAARSQALLSDGGGAASGRGRGRRGEPPGPGSSPV